MTTTTDLTTARISALRGRLRGTALLPGEGGYDEARFAWNLEAEHRPAVVVLPEDSADVQTAVRFAGSAGLGVGVLATGHGTGAPCDGGLLVSTRRMRGVHVDPAARAASVSAGAVWQDLVEAAAGHGLAGLPGSSTGVGVVGSTLGGGFGWLGRRYGLAAHSVTRARLVTADGELVTVGRERDPELFWGLAGSAGNLGVVTSLELRLHPVQQVYAGNLYYPLERAREVLAFFAEWSRSAPDELTSAATFRTFPPVPTLPAPLRGSSVIALRGCFCGDLRAGAALVDQARSALGTATVDTFATIPTSALASVSLDPLDPIGAVGHSELLRDLTPGVIDALVDLAGPDAASPLVMVELRQLGGNLPGPVETLSPLAHTGAAFTLNAIGVTSTPQRTVAVKDHLARLAAAVRPHSTGETYLNFLDLRGATPERIRAAFSAQDWDRLRRLKTARDPHNLFRFNRNIPPAETGEHAAPNQRKVSTP